MFPLKGDSKTADPIQQTGIACASDFECPRETRMPTNEEGEFELVLGNRQLLSVFFIVVVLLGVFFTMGYILGRNTGPKAEMAAARPSRPIEVQPPAVSSPVDLSRPPASKPEPAKAEPPKPEPAKPEPKKAEPEPKKPEPVVKAEPKPEPPKPEAAKPKPEPPARKAEPSQGGKGTYLQVSATTKREGDALVAKLGARGFSAITTPVPNSDLVRVLVGPVDDLADTRAKLKAAGYGDPIPRKL